MSITIELQRLTQAKADLKSAIETRGVAVNDTDTIDEFVPLLNSAPYTAKGSFTPEEDTDTFEISGLSYIPHTLSMVCQELYDNTVSTSIVLVYTFRNKASLIWFTLPNMTNSSAIINYTSSIITWGEDSIKVKIPSASTRGYFKKGYTYDYVISGGFAE